jgi:hypothetical protein
MSDKKCPNCENTWPEGYGPHCIRCGHPLTATPLPVKTDTRVSVPIDLFEWLVEYALELRGLWGWKRNGTGSNNDEMERLDSIIKQAVALRDAPSDRAEAETNQTGTMLRNER